MTKRPLPPGQSVHPHWPVEHYGRIPTFKAHSWCLRVAGLTASGRQVRIGLEELVAMPHVEVVGDLHCGRGWTVSDIRWGGVQARHILDLHPPADNVTHVLAWAEHGYTAVLRLADLRHPDTLLADTLEGEPLPPERGFPLRLVVPHLYGYKGPKWLRGFEYLAEATRGFWEDRGWHILADPWAEQRYSHQE